ncbi:hypothetical protein Nepgr_018758 [Nepenthes gracilis]|uniref:Uncharacterized protein n=1 Tax=Nepenthes gracilis TaxID=150966 RepID=A0AAD3XTE6_NEPGR|nr:hypothetical protein Nepgr_018758 [Nepenthes gracilis]
MAMSCWSCWNAFWLLWCGAVGLKLMVGCFCAASAGRRLLVLKCHTSPLEHSPAELDSKDSEGATCLHWGLLESLSFPLVFPEQPPACHDAAMYSKIPLSAISRDDRRAALGLVDDPLDPVLEPPIGLVYYPPGPPDPEVDLLKTPPSISRILTKYLLDTSLHLGHGSSSPNSMCVASSTVSHLDNSKVSYLGPQTDLPQLDSWQPIRPDPLYDAKADPDDWTVSDGAHTDLLLGPRAAILGMQMESNWVLGLNQVLVLISLDVVSAAVLLVLHPVACIAGRGIWGVDVGFCFYVLLVSVVPCRATVEFCVSPYA